MSNDFAYRPGAPPTSGGGGGNGGDGSGAIVASRPSGGGLPSGTDPRKWSARFPVYQIDFTAVASGKRFATTKRRVRWRFGFSNRDALEAGETGTACRGEEHDVTIVWSVTSGKRLILADGQEVHYSTNRGGVLEYSWTMRGNHVLKVVAHAAPAMTATPGFRQYDLFIDGQSFFNMPKVYELGLKGPIPSHARTPGVIDHAERAPASRAPPSSGRYYDLSQGRYVGPEVPRSRDEEEEDLQRAISASIEESRQHISKTVVGKHRGSATTKPAHAPVADVARPAPAPATGGDLLDIGATPPAPVLPAAQPAPVPAAAYDQFAVLPAPAPTSASPAATYDQFAAPPAYGVPPAPAESQAAQLGALVPAAALSAGSYYAQQAAAAPPAAAAPYDYGTQALPPAHAPPPAYDQFAAPPAPAADPFAPQAAAPPGNDPFAPMPPTPPTFTDISSTIMGAYGAADAGSAAGSVPVAVSPSGVSQPDSFAQPPAAEGAVDRNFAAGVAPTPQLAQLSINTQVDEEEDAPKDDVGKLMKSLVNIDDISSPVENLSLNPFADDREKEDKEKEKAQKLRRSRGIPPPAANWAGAQPSLSQMQHVKPTQSSERKSVMANSFVYDPNAAIAGTLVVHGSQNGGPPPLNQPTGFGVGASINGGGYSGHPPQEAAAAPQQQPGYGSPPMQHQQSGAPPPQQYQQPPAQQGYANYQY